MEKLTIKELAPYLPYNLRIITQSKSYTVPTITGFHRELIFCDYYNSSLTFSINTIKPLLRQLSDLTRAELEGEGFESYIDYLTYENQGAAWTLEAPYSMIEYLFSKHYDVFGLIEKGLAIDINTLT